MNLLLLGIQIEMPDRKVSIGNSLLTMLVLNSSTYIQK